MDIQTKAEWSDRFFNYPEAEAAYHVACEDSQNGNEVHEERGPQTLRIAAAQFIKEWPICPMTVEQLVADFIGRV